MAKTADKEKFSKHAMKHKGALRMEMHVSKEKKSEKKSAGKKGGKKHLKKK